ncbi:MAG: hypothetical protein CO187_09420 [Zetaproteobacteria bacterium CG_4_9_14_3_um_filter_53_7]|nr:MAG: hypothetical protein CO187_09420 [Zetaproteobacteria bacterium CG_4_9_14_3_um_filter_53_7]
MHWRFSTLQFVLIILLFVFLLTFVQMGLLSIAIEKLGLSMAQGMTLLFSSLLGSMLNLPLTTIKAEPPEVGLNTPDPRSMLRLPPLPFTGRTIIAINVGGCLVPLVFSASLIYRFPFSVIELVVAIILVSAICYFSSRPVAGFGIGMPPLVAPVAAALTAVMLNHELAAPLAYICGTLGVLFGADLLRMKDIGKLGAPIASIGGAGTFDGIFLTGIVAVLLT